MLTHRVVLSSIFFCLLAASGTAQTTTPNGSAQQPDSPSSVPSTATAKTTADSKPSDAQAGTSKDRLFYALPNFLTLENTDHLPPLTVGQKFKVEVRSTFDPVNFVWYGILAGISQAGNSESGYGQGAEGYGKRYGAAFGDGAIENFMVGAVYPSILRQDPRYYQSGRGSFLHRTGYAVGHAFVTRGDNGNKQFNFSEILGSASGAAISTYSYHPSEDRTLSNTASVWGTQLGLDTITFVIKEFWPDVRRKLHKNKTAPPQ